MSTSNRSCTAPHTFAHAFGSNPRRVSASAINHIVGIFHSTMLVQINMSYVDFEELCTQQGWSLYHENHCVSNYGTHGSHMARYNHSHRLATIFSR